MSNFNNDTNSGRVEKMGQTLLLIAKSAKANKASREEFQALLAPLLRMLEQLQIARPYDNVADVPQPGLKNPTWVTVREMSEQADLKDLSAAIAVLMNRFDEHLDECSRRN